MSIVGEAGLRHLCQTGRFLRFAKANTKVCPATCALLLGETTSWRTRQRTGRAAGIGESSVKRWASHIKCSSFSNDYQFGNDSDCFDTEPTERRATQFTPACPRGFAILKYITTCQYFNTMYKPLACSDRIVFSLESQRCNAPNYHRARALLLL